MLQVFKDLADPVTSIRMEATEWFFTEDFTQITLSAGWVPGAVWEVAKEIMDMSDLAQRRAVVDEVEDRFKKIEGFRC